MIVIVTRKSDGEEVTRYCAATIKESFDGKSYPRTEFDHVEYVEDAIAETPVDPVAWRIDVGSFFDRFGDAKISILASDNAVVQALIKDASVRQYISLVERKDELTQMLGLLQTLVPGITLDVTAILEVVPTEAERWNG